MEEWVGKTWHRWVTRAAQQRHPQAAVTLAQMQRPLTLLFRAAGGSPAVRLAQADGHAHGGPRGWLQRLAGSEQRAELAQLGPQVLALPAQLDVFADAGLNRTLYLWLAALSACWEDEAAAPGWVARNVAATARVLQSFPGLRAGHERLLAAQLAAMPAPAAQDPAHRLAVQALQASGPQGLAALPAQALTLSPQDLAPIWLWLLPSSESAPGAASRAAPPAREGARAAAQDRRRRQARRTQDSSSRQGLILMFRAESVLSWSEFVKVHRAGDDDPDADAAAVANDLAQLDVADGGETLASRVRFDLDLPSAAADDLPIGLPQRLPEWDWKAQRLLPDYCGLQRLVAASPAPWQPDASLQRLARGMRRRLELLRAAPRWRKGLPQGDELDLDAWVRHACEPRDGGGLGAGRGGVRQAEAPPVFQQAQRQERSLACLLMADLSLSTDASVQGETRVIDVIREALYVFGEALDGLGDPFEVLGFSSVKRQQVRIQQLKGFEEGWGRLQRQRVGAIKPGFYTRMGAALRHASERLGERPERQRLLLLLTDGKPNDLDHYEGRWGLEDTRHAVQAARQAGLSPFCISIDEGPADYLPHLFGATGYLHLRRPQELVRGLPRLYARLAAR